MVSARGQCNAVIAEFSLVLVRDFSECMYQMV